MKLYNMYLSNFASKCRIAIYEKGARVEIAPIPGGDLKSAEYLRIYPLGKTPSLDADGVVIGESEVINEYLEERFPTPSLLPKDLEGRARSRWTSRFLDLYLEPPLRALFPQVAAAEKDTKLIADKLAEITLRLEQLEAAIGVPYAVGGAFTLADEACQHERGDHANHEAACGERRSTIACVVDVACLHVVELSMAGDGLLVGGVRA